MDIRRILSHLFFTDGQLRRAFSPACLEAVAQAIRSSEQGHTGEIRFALEGALDGLPLFKGQTARERAIEVFSQLRVWDTEGNNGVLIYVLLADHAVEIVADRGIHVRAGAAVWEAICHQMELRFAAADFQTGALQGVAAVSRTLQTHFPGQGDSPNELPDEPVLLT
jgi:uncharacterized membrane protein